MPNIYTQLYIQFVFAVKHRESLIKSEWKNDLYKYITGIVQNNKSKMLAINGTADHIHIFIGYKSTIAIPDLVKDIKIASGLWINEKNGCLTGLTGRRVMAHSPTGFMMLMKYAGISKTRKNIIEINHLKKSISGC